MPIIPPFPEISRGCNKTGPHLSLPRAPGALDRRENNSRGIVAASSAESCRESWAADRKALKPRPLRPGGVGRRVFPSDFQVLRKVWKAVATPECCKRLSCPFIVARQAPLRFSRAFLSLLRRRIIMRTRSENAPLFFRCSLPLFFFPAYLDEAINRDVTR